MKKIVVVGSLNYDHTVQLDHLPLVGETIISSGISYAFGGKGANQAVALAKMQADVTMIGAVGGDDVGVKMIANLQKHNVKTDGIVVKDQEVTGFAFIYVDGDGKNMIVVHPGANFALTKEDIVAKKDLLLRADYCLLQLEIPLDVIAYVVALCHEHNIKVVLNPAPARELREDILTKVTYLVPNETELALLVKKEAQKDQLICYAHELMANGVKKVLMTLGEHGSRLVSEEGTIEVAARKVKAVDTTAAGDSFLGGFLSALSRGASEQEAIQFGTKVASITVTRAGAQDSIPSYDEVMALGE